jgi:hypothetical protein
VVPLTLFQTLARQCRYFEQRYMPWPLLLVVSLTIAAFVFGFLAP